MSPGVKAAGATFMCRLFRNSRSLNTKAVARYLCSPESAHTCSGNHPASYWMGAGDSFHGSKAAGVWSWPFTPSSTELKNKWGYTSAPIMPSWWAVGSTGGNCRRSYRLYAVALSPSLGPLPKYPTLEISTSVLNLHPLSLNLDPLFCFSSWWVGLTDSVGKQGVYGRPAYELVHPLKPVLAKLTKFCLVDGSSNWTQQG